MSPYDSLNPDDPIAAAPAEHAAVIIPESNLRLTYASLREQVQALRAIDVGRAFQARQNRVDQLTEPSGAWSMILKPLAAASVVLQTSARTGPAKPVRVSRANLHRSAVNVARSLSLGPGDVTLCVMPLTHVHGLVASTLAVLATGGTVVLPSAFHPLSFWRIARDYGVTWYTATPRIHQMLLARTADPGGRRPAGAARLRFIRSAGAPLWRQVGETLGSAFDVPVIDAYEVTEAAGQVASTSWPPTPRPGSVGKPVGVEVAVVGAAGEPLGLGERGEVVLRGPCVASGYENDPAATAKSFVDGWFHTGDLGYLDATGYLTLEGAGG